MNNYNQVSTEEQVQWNLAQALTMEIGNLRVKANAYFIKREIDKSFECLMAMRMTCNYIIPQTESTELDTLETECLELISIMNKDLKGFGVYQDKKEKVDARNLLYIKYRDYSNKLQSILDRFGFLGGRKADASKMRF